jgi:hypothetical protein
VVGLILVVAANQLAARFGRGSNVF